MIVDEVVALFSASRHAEAEVLARKMVQAGPDHGVGWKILGTVLAARRRFDEALPVLRKALELLPSDAEAHNAMGVALLALGRPAEAESSHRRALELRPDFCEGHNNLGNALQSMGRLSDALDSYRRALERNPDYAIAHYGLASALQALGRLSEAEAGYRRALELKPDYPEARNNLGNVLFALGRPSEAEASYRAALALKPDERESHFNLGIALQSMGRLSEAAESYRRLVRLSPGNYRVHNILGNVLQEMGLLSEALECYRHALELEPDSAIAHNGLGIVLQALGRLSEAESSCRRALELEPGYHQAHNNLGNVLRDLGRLSEAEASYRRALELNPELLVAHNNLGNALRDAGRLTEAEACYRRALEVKPDYHPAHNNLGNALRDLGRLPEAEASYRRALEFTQDYALAHSNLIFTLDLLEGRTIGEQQAERRRWYERHGQRHAGAIRPHENLPDPERKLRIGFVSADFRRHSAYYGFSPIILRHDRNAFEVVCYSGVKVEDDATARLRQATQAWRSTLGVTDEALAGQIRRDGIDILVDLSGHSAGGRLLAFARKPAPIQVTGWGFAGGTGLATMDYYASDAVVVPPGERGLYAEEVVYLPCGACYEAPAYAPDVSALPALEGKAFTFGCINRTEKISDRVMALWGRIFAQLPAARLLIKGRGLKDPVHRKRFLRRLADAGIEEGRVTLEGASRHAEHLRIFGEVDLGLDPFPHGGGISTSEALWMGVPVVALHGPTVASRITPSILTVLGMDEWIARSDEEYVRIAVEAARNLPGLARLRAQLRPRLAASALGDVQRYTREVEVAFRGMWRRWCAQRR